MTITWSEAAWVVGIAACCIAFIIWVTASERRHTREAIEETWASLPQDVRDSLAAKWRADRARRGDK